MRDLPIHTRSGPVRATVSIGVAMRNRGDPVSSEHIIALADAALYESKRQGRDRVTVDRAQR
jgi:PleD family two-component response regulator